MELVALAGPGKGDKLDGDTEARQVHDALIDALLELGDVIGLHEGPERHESFLKPPSIDLSTLPYGAVNAIRCGMDMLMAALGGVAPDAPPVEPDVDDAIASLLATEAGGNDAI